jgi:integrase
MNTELAQGRDPRVYLDKRLGKEKKVKARSEGQNFRYLAEKYFQEVINRKAPNGDYALEEKSRKSWRNSFEKYAFPIIGDMNLLDIKEEHILKIYRQRHNGELLYRSIPDTFIKFRTRLSRVMTSAYSYIGKPELKKDNPSLWQNLKDIDDLSDVSKYRRQRKKPMKAFENPDDCADLIQKIMKDDGGFYGRVSFGKAPLLFTAFTNLRKGTVLNLKVDDVNFKEKVLVIPYAKGHTDLPHPLSRQALAIAKKQVAYAEKEGADWLFPSQVWSINGKATDEKAVAKYLKKFVSNEIHTPHGFRRVWKTWGKKNPHLPCFKKANNLAKSGLMETGLLEILELQLSHSQGNETDQAYFQDKLIDARRQANQGWCDFLTGVKK